MRRGWLVVGLIVAVGVLVSAAASGKADAEAGKAVYTKKCASCHGPDGQAKEAIAKMLKVEMRHLGLKEIQDKTDADLRKAITEGTDKKKAVKGLSEEELANVIAFVRTLKK